MCDIEILALTYRDDCIISSAVKVNQLLHNQDRNVRIALRLNL